jgi:hypothetical protein
MVSLEIFLSLVNVSNARLALVRKKFGGAKKAGRIFCSEVIECKGARSSLRTSPSQTAMAPRGIYRNDKYSACLLAYTLV